MAEVERAANDLVHRIEGAVQRSLRMANAVALPYDGGRGGLVLAAALRRISDVDAYLVAIAKPPTTRPPPARRIARHLGLFLIERILPAAEAAAARQRALRVLESSPPPPQALDALADLLAAAQEARLHAPRLISALGWVQEALPPSTAPEHAALESALARSVGMEIRHPFLDAGVQRFAAHRPPDEGFGQPLLDEVLARLGLPPEVHSGPIK